MELTPAGLLEALLFSHGEALSKKRLLGLLEIKPEMLTVAIEELRVSLTGRGIELIETAEELELRTSAQAAPFVEKLHALERSRELGKAALEVLAIILYQGGGTRSEIDWIRGVNSTTALRSLLVRGLIVAAEDDADRRRTRYTASIDALAHLGITSQEMLPEYAEISTMLAAREAGVPAE